MRHIIAAVFIGIVCVAPSPMLASENSFSVQGANVLMNDEPFKIIGLRCSNALMADKSTDALVSWLPELRQTGVNTVSVFFMGSRFGDVKGYLPDATLDPKVAMRMGKIIEAADRHGMLVIVGCLYWSTSRAKEDLVGVWKQDDANRAIANTIRWLADNDYRNVFVDVDNEGMAHDATGWSIAEMIDAAHKIDPTIMVAYNDSDPPPQNADLYVHHSPKVAGKPWLDSEATPQRSTPGGYWGRFSKQTHKQSGGKFNNYSRIGRYTKAMKEEQLKRTRDEIENQAGHVLASPWLQCVSSSGVDGPLARAGGRSELKEPEIDQDIDTIHPEAGIAWWLDFIKANYLQGN